MDRRDLSAAELAGLLRNVWRSSPNTAGLAALEEAASAFASKYPDHIAGPYWGLATARVDLHHAYDSTTRSYDPEAWDKALEAAGRLADALYRLGDTRIARCGQCMAWGACTCLVEDDGTCRGAHEHIGTAEED